MGEVVEYNLGTEESSFTEGVIDGRDPKKNRYNILSVHKNFKLEKQFPASRIRRVEEDDLSLPVGTQVVARYPLESDMVWYRAEIVDTIDSERDTYAVEYLEGEYEGMIDHFVHASLVRKYKWAM